MYWGFKTLSFHGFGAQGYFVWKATIHVGKYTSSHGSWKENHTPSASRFPGVVWTPLPTKWNQVQSYKLMTHNLLPTLQKVLEMFHVESCWVINIHKDTWPASISSSGTMELIEHFGLDDQNICFKYPYSFAWFGRFITLFPRHLWCLPGSKLMLCLSWGRWCFHKHQVTEQMLWLVNLASKRNPSEGKPMVN